MEISYLKSPIEILRHDSTQIHLGTCETAVLVPKQHRNPDQSGLENWSGPPDNFDPSDEIGYFDATRFPKIACKPAATPNPRNQAYG